MNIKLYQNESLPIPSDAQFIYVDGDLQYIKSNKSIIIDGDEIIANINFPGEAILSNGKKIQVKRLLAGSFETIEMKLPALITADKHMNVPRHAGLRGVMAARKKEIPTWTLEDIQADPNKCGLSGSPTTVVEIFPPQRSHKTERLEGEPDEVARLLLNKLREAQLL